MSYNVFKILNTIRQYNRTVLKFDYFRLIIFPFSNIITFSNAYYNMHSCSNIHNILPGTGGRGEFSLKQRASFCRDPLILSIVAFTYYFSLYI